MQREIERLEEAGLVASKRIGNARIVEADDHSPVYAELRALLQKAFGPAQVVEDELATVPGIDEAYVFGSWARRYHGEPGALPADVDVLVIGSSDPDEIYRAARDAQERLGLDVNPVLISQEEWTSSGGLIERIKNEPLVPLEVQSAEHR